MSNPRRKRNHTVLTTKFVEKYFILKRSQRLVRSKSTRILFLLSLSTFAPATEPSTTLSVCTSAVSLVLLNNFTVCTSLITPLIEYECRKHSNYQRYTADNEQEVYPRHRRTQNISARAAVYFGNIRHNNV